MKYILTITVIDSGFVSSGQDVFLQDSGKVSSLNTPRFAEAFPFLSADGLRLYYTSGRDGAGRIYFSERASTIDSFKSAQALSNNLPDSFFAATLTLDELEIYLFDAFKDSCYYSKRSFRHEDFSPPVSLKEIGRCHRSPSISPNGNELIAIHHGLCISSKMAKDTIRLFKKNEKGIFEKTGYLLYPNDFRPDPGQFSKDGLSYFMSVSKRWYENGWQDSAISLKYSRRTLADTFGNYEIIFPELEPRRPHQVTFSGDGTIMVGVLTRDGQWEKNELSYYIKRANIDSVSIDIGILNQVSTNEISIVVNIKNLSVTAKSTLKNAQVDYLNGKIRPIGNYIVALEKYENGAFHPHPPGSDIGPVYEREQRTIAPGGNITDTITLNGQTWHRNGFTKGQYRVKVAFNWDAWSSSLENASEWKVFIIQ